MIQPRSDFAFMNDTPYVVLIWASYGVSFVGSSKKYGHDISNIESSLYQSSMNIITEPLLWLVRLMNKLLLFNNMWPMSFEFSFFFSLYLIVDIVPHLWTKQRHISNFHLLTTNLFSPLTHYHDCAPIDLIYYFFSHTVLLILYFKCTARII